MNDFNVVDFFNDNEEVIQYFCICITNGSSLQDCLMYTIDIILHDIVNSELFSYDVLKGDYATIEDVKKAYNLLDSVITKGCYV